MKIKKQFARMILTLGFVFCSFLAQANDELSNPNELFSEANQYFEKGNIDKASEIYNSLISQGYAGPNLYYNLGNYHYRKGERGKAILWYERAAQLSPRDSDVQFNLVLARSHLRDEEENLFQRIILFLTLNELSFITLFLGWAFFIVLGGRTLGWFKSDSWLPIHLMLTGTLFVFFVGWLSFNYYLNCEPHAIVTAPPGEVRNGPGNEYAVGFTIPEGSKVIILNKRPDWVQVGVPQQGLKGWMPKTDVELIQFNSALLG